MVARPVLCEGSHIERGWVQNFAPLALGCECVIRKKIKILKFHSHRAWVRNFIPLAIWVPTCNIISSLANFLSFLIPNVSISHIWIGNQIKFPK